MERNWCQSQVPSNHPRFAIKFRCLLMQEQSARELQEVGVIGVRNRGRRRVFSRKKVTSKLVKDTRGGIVKTPIFNMNLSLFGWNFLIFEIQNSKDLLCRSTVSTSALSTCSSFKMNNLGYQCIKHPWDSRSCLKGLGISKQGLVWSFRVDMSSCTFLVN